MSSYLVVQLYCTPAQADSVRTGAIGELARFPEFAGSRTELAPKAQGDHRLHLDWAEEHPGLVPGERTYFSLEMICPVDVPESVLRSAEDGVIEWIDKTFNDRPDDIAEVHWASYAEIRQGA
ncbi:hypothetical protein [Nocardia sp. NBC_01329]|uniref:hypothetical protein n=1 Tax=Nocardia sp. NBC_01329 TaxID=2903594 RepID=UPI002E1348D7|nr:hypothetical protein OG405_08870 [Nocardia sp. NBC_01329]